MADDLSVLHLQLADGTEFRLRYWKDVRRWHHKFSAAWDWMHAKHGNDAHSIRPNATTRLERLSTTIREAEERRNHPSDIKEAVEAIFSDSWAPVHQDSALGQHILRIRQEAGDEAGLFAWGLLKGLLNPQQAVTLEQFRGALLAGAPGMQKDDAVAKQIGAERTAAKAEIRRIAATAERAEIDRQEVFERLLEDTARRGIESAKRRSERVLRYTAGWRSEVEAAIESLRVVERTYKEELKLKASVQYWRDKESDHKVAEAHARNRLKVYFSLAILGVAIVFGLVGYYLINLAPKEIHNSVYFVATAGLGSLVGMVLWIGRLLTKLYFSEHHLRQDAAERAVMTTTYLALTAENAASDPDRKIVLTALFRATSDGIVKDDGALDPSVLAVAGRLVSSRP